MDCLRCALRNLRRKRGRTVLTVLSIAIGVASVVLISTIGVVGKTVINQELNSLGIGSLAVSVAKNTGGIQLQEEDLAAIQKTGNVEHAIPVLLEYSNITMRGLIADVAIWGVDAGSNQIVSLQASYGSLFTREDVRTGANVCLVDSGTAQGFYGRENIVGKPLRLMLGGSYEEFTIAGVVESGGNAMQSLIGEYLPMFVYIPYTTMQRMCGRVGFDRIAVQVANDAQTEQAAEQIVRELEHRNGTKGAYNADNIAQQKEKLNNLMNIVTGILSAVAGVSLVVAGLGIMTVMLVNVHERTREIGIKKAIGASRAVILFEFLAETFTISAIGSLVGTVFGLLVAAVGCAFLQIPLTIDLPMLLLAVGFAIVSGVIFGVYPSWVAAKLKPVDALRYE